MDFFTSVYFVILLCLIGVFLAVLLMIEIIRILSINKIRESKKKGASYICDLLCERFPEATVYKNVQFLKEEAEAEGLRCSCDVVYISRGGVLLMTVLPDTGNYDNPKIGPWRHRYINTRKEVITLQKENPFDTMSFFSSVAEKLMISENVLNPSVTRTVVFSADLVNFTTEYPECLTVGTLYDYVEAFNKRRHLNKEEYIKVCQAISACSDYLEGLRRPEQLGGTLEEPAPAAPQGPASSVPKENEFEENASARDGTQRSREPEDALEESEEPENAFDENAFEENVF